MFRCVLRQLKPSELYIFSCENGLGFAEYVCRLPVDIRTSTNPYNDEIFFAQTIDTKELFGRGS